MVRCIILEDTEIKELKFRLVKNVDFINYLTLFSPYFVFLLI